MITFFIDSNKYIEITYELLFYYHKLHVYLQIIIQKIINFGMNFFKTLYALFFPICFKAYGA